MGFQILGSDKILRMNNFPLLGLVQSLDWSPAFNAQDVFELGRTSKVDTSLELETSGSMELMSQGGLAGLLARTIVRRSGGAFTGYMFDETLASGTASAGTTTQLTTTGLTAGALVGKTLYITAGTNSGTNYKITANTTTTIDFSPAAATAMDNTSVFRVSGGKNSYTLVEGDFTESVFDLVEYEKSDEQNFDRAVILPRCFTASFSGRFDANGNANQTINFRGDFVSGAEDPYHDVLAVPATRTSASTLTLADTTLDNTDYTLMYLYVDEKRIRNSTSGDAITADLGAAGLVTITGTYTIPANAVLRVVLYKSNAPSSTFPVLSAAERTTSANYVRGYTADIFLAPAVLSSPTDNEKWLRVQSFDYNVDFKIEPLRQISYNAAGTSIYCQLPTLPFDVSCNLSVYESDWADWKAMLTKTFPGNDLYQDLTDLSPVNLKDTVAVVVNSYTKDKTLLETMTFSDLRLDGYGNRVNVGGRSELQWSLRGTAFIIQGYNA